MGINWRYDFPHGKYRVGYLTHDLDKADMFKLAMGSGMMFIDEINMELSEARRSMTNRNLNFNKVIQQLRKKELNLIYTVQHEMWVDDRLRYQTDIFIKCQDVVLKPGGMSLPFDFGTMCEWTIFDMSGHLGKGSYYETQQPFGTLKFYGKHWWHAYDTKERQGLEEEVYGKSQQLNQLNIEPSGTVLEAQSQWGWLYDKLEELLASYAGDDDENIVIEAPVLQSYLGVDENMWSIVSRQIWKMVPGLDKRGQGTPRSPYYYIFPIHSFDRPKTMSKKLVLASN
jgi:hypothetical protein